MRILSGVGHEYALKIVRDKKTEIYEIVDLGKSPILGLQSYRYLKNNMSNLVKNFITNGLLGKVEYTELLEKNFETEKQELIGICDRLAKLRKKFKSNEVLAEAVEIIGGNFNDEIILPITAAESLVEVRLQELRLLEIMKMTNMDSRSFNDDMRSEAKMINKEVYGKSNQKILSMILAEIFDSKEKPGRGGLGREVLSELKRFFNDEAVLFEINAGQGLPELNSVEKKWVLSRFENEFPGLIEEIQIVWNELNKFTSKQEISVFGIKECFRAAGEIISRRIAGFKPVIKIETGGTNMSYEVAEDAIIIGENRSLIKRQEVLMGKIAHELCVHSVRAYLGGLRSPLLRTGLHVDKSYLPFEEGLASTLEKIFTGTGWEMADMANYLNVALAERGATFREAYQIGWKLRAVMASKKGKPINEASIKELAYKSAVRVYRGCPIADDIRGLFYAKDLCYLEGKIQAIKLLKELIQKNDGAGFGRLFSGKYDPSVESHNKLLDCLA